MAQESLLLLAAESGQIFHRYKKRVKYKLKQLDYDNG
jgi:hypothetical protein